jgi:hypothetical protein
MLRLASHIARTEGFETLVVSYHQYSVAAHACSVRTFTVQGAREFPFTIWVK